MSAHRCSPGGVPGTEELALSRRSKHTVVRANPLLTVLATILLLAAAPATASAATAFGPLSGADGCLVAPGSKSADNGTEDCGAGKALVGASAVAISPDGQNVYVASGTAGTTQASSFGSLAILRRNAATGAISETGCLSSDGTDGRDGASGACVPTPALLGADGVTVSPDGLTVFVTANISGSVVAFAREPATGSLTNLGCFQYRPPHGSKCPPANVFQSAAAVVSSADSKALYVAAPTQGAISTLIAGEVTAPSGAPASPAAAGTVASIFGPLPTTEFLGNPCVAVNGFDGSCGVGIATRGLDALTLSPDGAQLYAAAPGSEAVDVFTHDATGTLTESSCLKVSAPPGLCRSSKLMNTPTELSISPDGRNVYVADTSEDGGRVDVLARDPSTGALSDSSCVEQSVAPKKQEEQNEEEEQEEPTPARGGCDQVPGLESVDAVAVTGNGSEVYAIGDQSAVVFSRDQASGKLTELSCAAAEDSRCTSFPSLQGVEGAAVSPDGRYVYIAAAKIDAVLAFGVGSNVTTARASATRAGVARVRVQCPRALRRPCAGHLELMRAVRARASGRSHRRRLERIVAGGSARFAIKPGARATISVHLSAASRRLLLAHRRLRLMAIVRAEPLAGGSGYGRALRLSLGPH
jgi:DNA-binding beta-propeller fold protein YncE